MFNHVYFVPTHRIIENENLDDFSSEITFACNKFNIDIPFLILDDFKDEINKENIIKRKDVFRDIKYYHFNSALVTEILTIINNRLSKDKQPTFLQLFPKGITNYGSTFNRMFILNILFGSEFLHRRDSDVLIDRHAISNESVFPIELEIRYLSKNIEGKKCYIVGGGYKGKYNLDIDFLIKNEDYSLLKRFFDCMSIPAEHHEDIINEEILGNNLPFEKDNIEFNSRAYPECGNISFYKLFEYLPCCPEPYTLGTDYFPIEIAIQTGINLTYHNRAVIHRHTKCRYDTYQKVFDYWKGIAKLIDVQVFYRNFYSYLNNSSLDMTLFITKPECLNREILDYLKEYIPQNTKFEEIRQTKFENFISLLRDSSEDGQLAKVAQEISKIKCEVFQSTNKSLIEHMKLLEIWPSVIDILHLYKEKDQIKNLLEKAKL